MRISRILSPVTALGPGRRVGVWVQGCDLACSGCASTDTWDRAAGRDMTEEEVAAEVLELIGAENLTGLTLSGGEPFQQGAELARVVQLIRVGAPDIDVLVFTGYPTRIARRRSPALFELVDVVIAGPYDASLPSGGPLVASSNQEVTMQTPRGRDRFAMGVSHQLQVAATDMELFILGIPEAGDLDRLETELAGAGITLGDVSWRA